MTGLPELRQWFRVDEVALIFGVSSRTVRNWLDDGTLEARAIASPLDEPQRKHVRVTKQSIVKLLNDERRVVV